MLDHYKRQEESPDCAGTRFGDSFFVQMDCSYPFAYWHYSICRPGLQYAPQKFYEVVFYFVADISIHGNGGFSVSTCGDTKILVSAGNNRLLLKDAISKILDISTGACHPYPDVRMVRNVSFRRSMAIFCLWL